MSLKSPTTYQEWYWGSAVNAGKQEQEDYERELSPAINATITGLNIMDFLPPSLSPLFSELMNPSAPAWGAVLARFGSEVADGVVSGSLNHALQDFNYQMAEWFQDLKIDANTASLLWSRDKITEEMYSRRMTQAGYDPPEAAAFLEAHLPYPDLPDVMRWARYQGNPDAFQADVLERYRFDTADWPMWEWLTAQVPHLDQIQTLYRKGTWDHERATLELRKQGWGKGDAEHVLELAYQMPNPMLLAQSGLRKGFSDDDIIRNISIGGISPVAADAYFDAIRTKPATEDIIRRMLRHDPQLNGLDDELRKVGIHPEYWPVYKELAYFIPPVNDIITMAVREAFSPDIAKRFGQYDDYPTDLTKYSAMQGVSEEWAKRYWASHWALPSPQQGFEMLHRGVIDESDLDLLLRASDVMPFWRDKLVAIAFKPLTRVDVRRMYGLGVLTEQEVYESYLDVGYSETNAQRMADFTVKQVLASQSGFSSGDIVKAFNERIIDRGDAIGLLTEIGIKGENAQIIVKQAEYTRAWDYVDERIKAIKNMYKKSVYDENVTRDALAGLDLASTEVTTLMEQWYFEKKEDPSPLWTASQTLSFIKKGLIDEERGIMELRRHGYDQEHINVYIAQVNA